MTENKPCMKLNKDKHAKGSITPGSCGGWVWLAGVWEQKCPQECWRMASWTWAGPVLLQRWRRTVPWAASLGPQEDVSALFYPALARAQLCPVVVHLVPEIYLKKKKSDSPSDSWGGNTVFQQLKGGCREDGGSDRTRSNRHKLLQGNIHPSIRQNSSSWEQVNVGTGCPDKWGHLPLGPWRRWPPELPSSIGFSTIL